ncbi:MAG: hypothetical protein OEM53_08705, partial [Nitrosopumilus sp.]|nr:hypothetical protein [Nitrosopumilus sp.]
FLFGAALRVAAFLFGAALRVAAFLFGAALRVAAFLFGAALRVAAFLFGAALRVAVFLAVDLDVDLRLVAAFLFIAIQNRYFHCFSVVKLKKFTQIDYKL